MASVVKNFCPFCCRQINNHHLATKEQETDCHRIVNLDISNGRLQILNWLSLKTDLKLQAALGSFLVLFLPWRKQFILLLWASAAVTRVTSSEGWFR